jgi:hypothetical protein
LTSCSFDYLSRDFYSRLVIMLMFVFGFFIPLLLIILFYILTKKEMNKRSSKICNKLTGSVNNHSKSHYKSILQAANSQQSCNKAERDLSTVPRCSNTHPSRSKKNSTKSNPISERLESRALSRHGTFNSVMSQRKNFNSILNREQKAMRAIVMNVTMFIIAWVPYVIMVLCAQFGSNISLFLNPYTASLPAVFAKISSIYNPVIYTLSNRECQIYFKRAFKCRK